MNELRMHAVRMSPADAAHSRLAVALMLLATALAYANAMHVPFVLDDVLGIVQNPTLQSLWPLSGALTPVPGGLTVSGRPILNLSLALNHAISGTEFWSYHLFNLLIHCAAGLLLFGIVRRTLVRCAHPDPVPLAGLVAALWLVHPLQTESVTYTIQRAESLMGLFYLLTLYAMIRGAEARAPWAWHVVAVVACALGMGTKEVMATAPILLLLYDRAFVAGGLREAWRQRKVLYGLLALTWVLLAWLMAQTGNRDGSYGLGIGNPWWSHALMQPQGIIRYLRLTLWPDPLIFDYGVLQPRQARDVVPYAVVVMALLIGTGYGLIRNSSWGFLGAWFFLILAPTSSLLPSNRQTFSEHRIYLPLAAASVIAVLALYRCCGRKTRTTVLVGALCVSALCLATAQRNRAYRSDLDLYANVLTTYPDNAYGHFVIGNALVQRGRDDEALPHFDAAVRLRAGDKAMHVNRAYTLFRLQRAAESVAEYEAGFRLGPVGPDAFLGYAAALVAAGRSEEGLNHLSEYSSSRLQDPSAQLTVGQLLLAAGRPAEALGYIERAHALAPADAQVATLLEQVRTHGDR